MTQIFISYSRKDLGIAEKIIDALAKYDLEPWIDWKSIPKGETFESEIQQGIEKAEIFLFLISPDSIQSGWCNKEIVHAVKNGKRILPFVIRDTDLKNIHPEIANRNWIFCRDGQDNFNMAMEEAQKTIRTNYEWLKYHTELQVKALKWEQKKDASQLLRGKELREAEKLFTKISSQEDPQPTKVQHEYFLAGQMNEIRTRRQIIIGLVIGLGIIGALTFMAWEQRKSAVIAQSTAAAEANARATAQIEAETQGKISLARRLAAQAQPLFANGNSKQETAVLLAIQSIKLFPTIDAAKILQNNTLAYPIALFGYKESLASVAVSPDGRYIAYTGCDQLAQNYNLCDQAFAGVWEIASGKEIARKNYAFWVTSIAFSPDSNYVVSGGDDNVQVWEVISGKEVIRMTHDFGSRVYSVAFSPDGKYVASGSEDSTSRVWEVSTGKETSRMTMIKNDIATSVAFSPDGRYIASGSWDGVISIWKAATGEEVIQIKHNQIVQSVGFSPSGKYVISDGQAWEVATGKEISFTSNSINANIVVFSPDEKLVASSEIDGIIHLRDATTGAEIISMSHEGSVNTLVFTLDGKYLVSGSADNTTRVWDVATGSEIARMTHDSPVITAAFSPDGKLVISGSSDGVIRVWIPNNGREVTRINLETNLTAINFSPNGRYVVLGSQDNTTQVWDITIGKEIAHMAQDAPVNLVAFSPDGNYVVSGSEDKSVRVLELNTGKEITRKTHDDSLALVVFSPNSKIVISGSYDGIVKVWESATGIEIVPMIHDFYLSSVAFNPDSTRVLLGGCDQQEPYTELCIQGSARIWDTSTGMEIVRMTHAVSVDSVAFSPDGKIAISGGCDQRSLNVACVQGSVKAWDVVTGNVIAAVPHDGSVNFIVLSLSGRVVISGSDDGTVRIWETKTGKEITPIKHNFYLYSNSLSSDGKYVALEGCDQLNENYSCIQSSGRVWDINTGDEISNMTSDGWPASIAFSPDNKFIVTGSADTVRVWEVATGNEVAAMVFNGPVASAIFSPDGRNIISAGGFNDNTIRVWRWRQEDLITEACARITHNFTQNEWIQFVGNTLPYQAVCPDLPIEPEVIITPTP